MARAGLLAATLVGWLLVSGSAAPGTASGSDRTAFAVVPVLSGDLVESFVPVGLVLPSVGATQWVAVHEGTNRIYAQGSGTNIVVVEGDQNAASHVLALNTTGIAGAINPLTHRLYLAQVPDATVTVIDLEQEIVERVLPLAEPAGFAVVDPLRNKVFLSHGASGRVSILDENAYQVRSVVLPGPVGRLAADPTHGRVLVHFGDAGDMAVLDAATDTLAGVVPLGSGPVGGEVGGFGYNPATNKAYGTNGINPVSTITILDLDDGARRVVHVEREPLNVAVDAPAGLVYVAAHHPSRLWVLDAATDQVAEVELFAFGNPALSCQHRHAAATNPVTGRLHLPCLNSTPRLFTVYDCGRRQTLARFDPCELPHLPPPPAETRLP